MEPAVTASDLQQSFSRVYSVIEQGLERGLHTGCQLYVSQYGTVRIDAAIGESQPGLAMTPHTINLWLSAGKPLTAAVILQLAERGFLNISDPVALHIPEFAAGGKSPITIENLLTHTCGFRNVDTGYPAVGWDESIRRICESPLEENWIIGQSAGYHTTTSWFILGEIIRRASHREYANVMRDDLLVPLGLVDSWAAIPESIYDSYGTRIGWMAAREQGVLRWLDWHNRHRCASPSPGSNTRGPIRDLGRFYEMLLNDGRGPAGQLLSPNSVKSMRTRHRIGAFDQTLGHVVDFGLGVIIDSNTYGAETIPYGYGKYCSNETFGHGGAQTSQGFCDYTNGLVVAYYFNGRAGEGQHNRRGKMLNEAIYLDLGLASE